MMYDKVDMDSISIRKQKEAGTKDRNEEIKFLRSQGISMPKIGKLHGVSRQRIFQIVNNKEEEKE